MTKGLSQTLWIVVVIVVLLVVALVVLTIFGTSIGQFGSIAEARNNCLLQLQATCAATNTVPLTWDNQFTIIGDPVQHTCREYYANCAAIPTPPPQ